MIRKLSTKLSKGWSERDKHKTGPIVTVRLSAHKDTEYKLNDYDTEEVYSIIGLNGWVGRRWA